VVVIDLTQEIMALSVINQPTNAVAKLSIIVKIHKYKRFHEGHHFISMAMEVHGTLGRDMDCFIRECARLFHDRRLGCHLSLPFCIQFFKQCVSIVLQCALTFAIKKKIVLASDAYSRPPITIKSHDLHACNIKRVKGNSFLPQEGLTLSLFLFFGSCGLYVFWPFFGLPFLSPL
jgi:hypothetical protein